MTARVLCFAALDDAAPAPAAAAAACAAATGPVVRPLALDPAAAPAAVREIADRLAEYLHLRAVAHELAALAVLVTSLRESAGAIVIAHSSGVEQLTRLASAADLARDRLTHERPPAGSSTLAAQRAAGDGAELAILTAAAAGGDVLRAPELTITGLLGGSDDAQALGARQLMLVGVPCAGTLDSDPAVAATQLLAAPAARDLSPRPVLRAGGDPILHVPLPELPGDLRGVRAGHTLALHAAGVTRRLTGPAVLGPRRPGQLLAAPGGLDVTLEPMPEPR